MEKEEERAELYKKFAPIRAILWDIDGTLFSAESLLGATYRQAFIDFQKNTKQEIKVPSVSEILAEIGKPVKEIFHNLAPFLIQEEQERLSLSALAKLVESIHFGGGHYYENMPQVLKTLYKRGYLFFSASNGRYPYIESILRISKTIHYFQPIETINNQNLKNKSKLVAHILKKYQLEPREAVLIGDRKSDRDAAWENRIAFIACSYGHGQESEWKDAVLRIHSLGDLEKHLLGTPAYREIRGA